MDKDAASEIVKIIKSMANLDVEGRTLPNIEFIKVRRDDLPEFRVWVLVGAIFII